jgi:hypothetical protein
MANAKKKPVARRSRRSGIKKAELLQHNSDVLYNVWTALNAQQVLKNYK